MSAKMKMNKWNDKMTVKMNTKILKSVMITMGAIEDIDKAILYYSEDKPGPAYVFFEHTPFIDPNFQFDRDVMISALTEQKRRYVENLKARYGVEYDPNAPMMGMTNDEI